MAVKLTSIGVGRFKSIKDLQDLDLRPINVLIGANGSGKSNLISFFKLFNAIGESRLHEFVGKSGGAEALLYYGTKLSPEMWASLRFRGQTGDGLYLFNLAATADDSLIFAVEQVEYSVAKYSEARRESLGSGHKESLLPHGGNHYAEVWNALTDPQIFHFHDTSDTAAIRKHGYIDDNRYLRNDAGNLAAFLLGLKQRQPLYYGRIRDTIRQIAPFFDDFVLEPPRANENTIRLNWKDPDSVLVFGPHQLSDGTLRAMALVTLLLQPEDELPPLVVIDEPEIGLHPYAIEMIASLIRAASVHATMIVATQSAAIANHFAPEDIITVTRSKAESVFRRLNPAELENWLKDYSVGELWEKNLIGGTPSR